MDSLRRALSWLLLAALWAAAAPAQDGKVDVEARFEPAKARPGDTVKLVLRATVTPGYHAYGSKEQTNIPVTLKPQKLQAGGLELVGEALVPPGEKHTVLDVDTYPLPDEFEVTQTLRVPAGAAAGEVVLSGELDYQICDENSCLPPDVAKFTAKLQVEAGAGAAPATGPPAGAAAAGGAQQPVAPKPSTKPGLRLEPDQKLTLTAALVPAKAKAGEAVELVLEATVDPRYHAYGTKEETNLPVALPEADLQLGGLAARGPAVIPPGDKKVVFGLDTYPLPQVFRVTLPLAVPAGMAPGEVEVRGKLRYQLCDENSCDLPAVAAFAAKLTVVAGEAPPAAGSGAAPAAAAGGGSSGGPSGAFGSLWALVLACIGGGLFALVMPCTYPMIPITFSFFTKQAEKRGGHVLPLALLYGTGIVLMFVAVGVGLSWVILDIANHWLTNSVIGVVFLLFAFSLFGWIDLQPPRFLQDAASSAGRSGGLLGVFFMGAALVVTSFTCTAPIVGSLIANVASYGPAKVALGMAVFGLTMAAPFVGLALLPGRVKALPRSGEWMETVKVSLGFVELAAVLKFVSMVDIALDWNALPRELFLILCAAIFQLWALYLFGILRKAGSEATGVGGGRMATGMAATLLAAYCFYGSLGYRVDFYLTTFAPPYSAEVVTQRGGGAKTEQTAQAHGGGGHAIVLDDEAQALALAKAQDKLLLYNFTGFN